jgi:hypothetical protein
MLVEKLLKRGFIDGKLFKPQEGGEIFLVAVNHTAFLCAFSKIAKIYY